MYDFIMRMLTPAGEGVPSLMAEDLFLRALTREQQRADRSGEPFSLLAITVPEADGQEIRLHQVATYLDTRVRANDFAGQLSENSIGVLLPETTPDAAWKLADDVRNTLDTADDWLHCEIFAYPFGDDKKPEKPKSETETASETTSKLEVKPIKYLL